MVKKRKKEKGPFITGQRNIMVKMNADRVMSGCEHPVERLSLHVDQHVESSRHGYCAWCASLQRGICSGGGSSMEQGSIGTAAQSAVGVRGSVWRSKVESSLQQLPKRKRGGADKIP